jgi:hypothetical protein
MLTDADHVERSEHGLEQAHVLADVVDDEDPSRVLAHGAPLPP